MKTTLVVAALVGGLLSVAAPLPAQAASSIPGKCLFFPLLQADCRAAIGDAWATTAPAVAEDLGEAAGTAASNVTKFPSPLWWAGCSPSDSGTHLLDCD